MKSQWSGVLLVVLVSACGPVEGAPESESPSQHTQELDAVNGLSLNGLSLNGLSLNGLSLNGLSLNGLSAAAFHTWFEGDPLLHDGVMRYVVSCAAPAGVSRTYASPTTGRVHVWVGRMGLAPDWTQGMPATLAEQRIVSACLAAHANNYGLNVSISVLGRDAKGTNIPYSSEELTIFAKRESCFFGNVFTNQGLFAGNDRTSLAADESTRRPCGLKGFKALDNPACSQVKRIGQCEDYCTLDASGNFYTHCTYNGVQYKPLNTRLRQADINRCGDGVCQMGESCGWGITADSCLMDCGTCAY